MSCSLYRSFSILLCLSFYTSPPNFINLSAKIIHFQVESKRFLDIFIFLTKNTSDIIAITKIIKNDNKNKNIFAYLNYFIYLCPKIQK